MSKPQVETNAPYTARVQLLLTPAGLTGPLVQFGPTGGAGATGPLGTFDPRRDLEIYVDGSLINVLTFSFDTDNNRYLMFANNSINLQGVIQVVHRMPSPPFVDNTLVSTVSGFAVRATFSTSGDPTGWGILWGQVWGAGN